MSERFAVALDLVLAAFGEREAHAALAWPGVEKLDRERQARSSV